MAKWYPLEIPLLLMVILIPTVSPSMLTATAVNGSVCSNDTEANQEATLLSSTNSIQVRNVAQPYVDAVRGNLTSSLFGMAGIFGQKADCSPFVEGIKLGYSLSNLSGVQRVVIVTESPAANSVINATEDLPKYFGNYAFNSIWSGYEYYDSSGIRQSGAGSWNEPSISSTPTSMCDLTHCDYAFWVGITHESGGPSGIVQTGSDSGLYCAFGSCSSYYYTWYEDYPSPELQCFNVNIGDSITAKAYFSHSDTHQHPWYNTYLKDNTNGQSCSSSAAYNQGWITYYAQFMGERPTIGGSPARLPEFTQLGMSGGYYINWGGSTITIGSGWTNDWIMSKTSNSYTCNGVSLKENICNGAVSSGYFYELWKTSDGT